MINALGAAPPNSNPPVKPNVTPINVTTSTVVNPQGPTSPITAPPKASDVKVNPQIKEFKSGKKKISPKTIIGILILIILLIGGGGGFYLMKRSQELRQQAAEVASCSQLLDQTVCNATQGCAWKETTGSCNGKDEGACKAQAGCEWKDKDIKPCGGVSIGECGSGKYASCTLVSEPGVLCNTFTDAASCRARQQDGCSWDASLYCDGTWNQGACEGGTGCFGLENGECQRNGCTWKETPQSCKDFGTSNCESHAGCTLKDGGHCSGIANPRQHCEGWYADSHACEGSYSTGYSCQGTPVTGECPTDVTAYVSQTGSLPGGFNSCNNNGKNCLTLDLPDQYATCTYKAEEYSDPGQTCNNQETNKRQDTVISDGGSICFNPAGWGTDCQAQLDIRFDQPGAPAGNIKTYKEDCAPITTTPSPGVSVTPTATVTSTPAPTYACDSPCTTDAQCEGVNAAYQCYETSSENVNWTIASPWVTMSAEQLAKYPGTITDDPQAIDVWPIPNTSTLYQAFWRNNVSYYRIVAFSGTTVNWDAAQWKTGADLKQNSGALPGDGNIMALQNYILPGDPNLRQQFWRGNVGYWRIVPLDTNGNANWSAASAWVTMTAEQLAKYPGTLTDNVQAIDIWVIPNTNTLYQAFWRNNVGYYRIVPFDGTTVNWDAAQWKTGTDLNQNPGALPGDGNLQALQNYILPGDSYLRQQFWRGNVGYWRIVPFGGRCRHTSYPTSSSCTPLEITNTPTPTPTGTTVTNTPTATPTITLTSTPAPGGCGSSCSSVNCNTGLTCVAATDNSYCALGPYVSACISANSSNAGSVCCSSYITNPPPPTSIYYTVAPTTYTQRTVAYTTPIPGCNSACTSNADCTNVNANWICYQNVCRLDVNPESAYCAYPQQLLETGPKEWLNILKIGLGMLGTAALLLLLL